MTSTGADGLDDFLARARALPVTAIGRPGEQREELTRLVLDGVKVATTSVLAEYAELDEPVPVAGQRFALLGPGDDPVAIIELNEVLIRRFDAVDDRHAVEEGEGFDTADGWRAQHLAEWPHLAPDSLVVLERFRVVEVAPEESPEVQVVADDTP
jgi:uncharacterized protein YhfF